MLEFSVIEIGIKVISKVYFRFRRVKGGQMRHSSNV